MQKKIEVHMEKDLIIEDSEYEFLREVNFIKCQNLNELKEANEDYEQHLIRKPAKIIVTKLINLKNEVQFDTLPF